MQRLSRCWTLVLGVPWLAACAVGPAQELALTDMLPRSETAPTIEVPAYTVFFELDSAEVTADAAAILEQLAKDPERGRWTRVILAGHADRSGSERRNKNLSAERAEAVRRYLLGIGVPPSMIASVALGERQGLVGTPDGTVEPQNRRVEVYLRSN